MRAAAGGAADEGGCMPESRPGFKRGPASAADAAAGDWGAMINRAFFYDEVRLRLMSGKLKRSQVEGLDGILDEWEARHAEKDDRWLAYMLATVHHETDRSFRPIREYGGPAYFTDRYDPVGSRPELARRMGNLEAGDGPKYCGRGFVQLTWRANYRAMSGVCGVDLEAEAFEQEPEEVTARLEKADGILVPGGFGERGTEGKIQAIRFARERNVPYFGICFGMQMAVIEATRDVGGLDGASSTEFGPAEHPVVGLMTEWLKGNELETRKANGDLGGTMRLGAYPARLSPGSKAAQAYGSTEIVERHRHRYEVNIRYRDDIERAGLRLTGMSPDGLLPEIVEREDHPWFIGVQYHPELKSRPFAPHPLFASFVAAAKEQSRLV